MCLYTYTQIHAEPNSLHEYKYGGTIEDVECCDQLDLDVEKFVSWFEYRLNGMYVHLGEGHHRCNDSACVHGPGEEEGHLYDFTGRRLLWWKPILMELRRAGAVSKKLRSSIPEVDTNYQVWKKSLYTKLRYFP